MREAARRSALGLLVVIALAGSSPGALGAQAGATQIVAEDRYPARGETTELAVEAADGRPVPGIPLRARYRPNSETAHVAEIGTTGADGRLDWTPGDAGVVLLEAGEPDAPAAQTRVSVRFGAFPPLGLLVMVVAAALLFGGAALGFVLLLRAPNALPADEPPST